MYYFLICTSFLFFKVHVVPKPFTCPCGKSLLVECHLLDDQIVRGPITANVWVCEVAGIRGLNNGAKRNVKPDQLRPVPRHNVNKENESNEDTDPGNCANLLLAVVGPFSSLHS
jgi:hypothetical protein